MKEIQKPRNIRVNDSRWQKFNRLGGVNWLRDQIDKAKEPAKTPLTKD